MKPKIHIRKLLCREYLGSAALFFVRPYESNLAKSLSDSPQTLCEGCCAKFRAKALRNDLVTQRVTGLEVGTCYRARWRSKQSNSYRYGRVTSTAST